VQKLVVGVKKIISIKYKTQKSTTCRSLFLFRSEDKTYTLLFINGKEIVIDIF